MTNLGSILKSRHTTLPTKVQKFKIMVFPVVMYACESWTIKKAECRWFVAFKLWCWRRLLLVPWTARRSNQSFLQKTNLKYLLRGLGLKLNLQYFGYLMQRAGEKRPWCWKSLKAGGQQRDNRRRMIGWHHWLNGHEFEQTQGDSEGQGRLMGCSSWHCKVSDMT